MSNSLWTAVKERKAQRIAALHELRSCSMMLWNTTLKTFDDFEAPAGANVRELRDEEVLIVDTRGATTNRIWIKNLADGTTLEVISDEYDPGAWNQITLMMDSGGIGRAGVMYAKNELQLNVFAIWGKIHRAVRDVRLAADHSENGEIQRALLFMCHVWSLHSKPFGSGAWFEMLQACLEHFRATHTHRSTQFRYYGAKWAADLGFSPPTTDAEWENLWDLLAELLDVKIGPPKISRWFSANEKQKWRGSDFWPVKMLLRHYHGMSHTDADESFEDPVEVIRRHPRQELQALKASNGGLKLAELMMTEWLHSAIEVG
jgi:hypothetical protein